MNMFLWSLEKTSNKYKEEHLNEDEVNSKGSDILYLIYKSIQNGYLFPFKSLSMILEPFKMWLGDIYIIVLFIIIVNMKYLKLINVFNSF